MPQYLSKDPRRFRLSPRLSVLLLFYKKKLCFAVSLTSLFCFCFFPLFCWGDIRIEDVAEAAKEKLALAKGCPCTELENTVIAEGVALYKELSQSPTFVRLKEMLIRVGGIIKAKVEAWKAQEVPPDQVLVSLPPTAPPFLCEYFITWISSFLVLPSCVGVCARLCVCVCVCVVFVCVCAYVCALCVYMQLCRTIFCEL